MKTYHMVQRAAFFVLAILSLNTHAAEPSFTTPNSIDNLPYISIVPIDSMDLPSSLKSKSRREIQEMRNFGVRKASDEDVSVLENYLLPQNQRYLKNPNNAFDDLAIQASDVSRSILGDGEILAVANEGTILQNGWTGLTRLFQAPPFSLVLLSELDFVLSNSYIQIPEESINENVNGNPAIFVVRESPGGKALSVLQWYTETKRFTLTTSQKIQVESNLYSQFVEIAESLE